MGVSTILKSPQRAVHTGIVNDAMLGVGVGTTVNVIDKKLLQGKMTAAGISIGQTLNAKPLCINVTDLVTLMLVVGSPTNWTKKSGLIRAGVTFATKKVFEAFDYIDPPSSSNAAGTSTTNIVYSRSTPTQNQARLGFSGGLV